MAKLNDLEDVTISNPKAGDVVKYTATGWVNGADVTGTPPGGNPCGELDDFLRRNIDEEITGTYTWKGADAESKIIVESPTETTQLTGGSIIFTDRASGESGRIQITNATDDLMLRSSNKLFFKDSTLTDPVSLAELVACCDDGAGGGGSGGGFAPMMRDFTIDENASAKQFATSWNILSNAAQNAPNKEMVVTYGKGWVNNGFNGGSIIDVMQTQTESFTMPAGANAAIVIYGGSVLHAASDADTARSVHTAHRLRIRNGATWVPINGTTRNDYIGSVQKSIVAINDANALATREHRRTFQKTDMIQFSEGATVVFENTMTVQKGGRARIQCRAGRVTVIPFTIATGSLPQSVNTFSEEENDQAWLDYVNATSPPLTPAEDAIDLGRSLRDRMRRAISALDSRKLHAPVGSPKTQADYEEQIGLLWSLLDAENLLSYDATAAALEPIFEEISKPEYGVADLFQYEIEAGASTRRLF